MNDTIYQAAALVIPLVIAIVFHEIAHGWTARALGDPTAEQLGRLTINPLKHVDLFGTIILPGILKLSGLPVFGWAKPVPVDFRRLNNPRRDMMLVGAAGPAMNFVMALGAAIVLGLIVRLYGGEHEPVGVAGFIVYSLAMFLQINIFLALFNLLPIPPFDGSHIVEGLLPDKAARAYSSTRRYALPVMIVVLVLLPRLGPGFDLIGRFVEPPFEWLINAYLGVVGIVAGR